MEGIQDALSQHFKGPYLTCRQSTTLNEVLLKIDSHFGNTDVMRGHQLENDLISLIPTHFEMIQDFFTKFKSLVLQLKQCGILEKEEQLILSIILKLCP